MKFVLLGRSNITGVQYFPTSLTHLELPTDEHEELLQLLPELVSLRRLLLVCHFSMAHCGFDLFPATITHLTVKNHKTYQPFSQYELASSHVYEGDLDCLMKIIHSFVLQVNIASY